MSTLERGLVLLQIVYITYGTISTFYLMSTGGFSGKQSARCVKLTHAMLRVILRGYVCHSRNILGHHGILGLKKIQFWVYLCKQENFTIYFFHYCCYVEYISTYI